MLWNGISHFCLTNQQKHSSEAYLPTVYFSWEIRKVRIWHNKPFENEISDYQFNVLDEPKPKLITIKPDTPKESKIKGYKCRFSIRLPKELMELLVETGIGSKGSQGFGMVNRLKA